MSAESTKAYCGNKIHWDCWHRTFFQLIVLGPLHTQCSILWLLSSAENRHKTGEDDVEDTDDGKDYEDDEGSMSEFY